MGTVSIKNLTRQPLPGRRAFSLAATAVLPDWDISLVFVGQTRAKQLNQSLRGMDYVPNVLSYEAGDKSGEIIICPTVAAAQAPEYGLPLNKFYLYLFIHGLGHLAGRAHGATMEQWEQALLTQIAGGTSRVRAHESTHRDRNRHRDTPNQTGGRRRNR